MVDDDNPQQARRLEDSGARRARAYERSRARRDRGPIGSAAPRASRKGSSRRKQGLVARVVNHWWDRLSNAATDRSFADQTPQYESGRTKRDFVCNSIGIGAWGMVFPLLTIIITQLSGAETAGMFSLAFVTATLLMYLGNYGVRTYQVSDIDEHHSFADYQLHRVVTCVAMLAVGYLYCRLRGYDGQMLVISAGVYLYRMSDALADVYEGRLQQVDKMYLAGISQGLRSVVAVVFFTVFLLVGRDVGVSSMAMGVSALVTFLAVTLPLTYFESHRSRKLELSSVVELFRLCAPLFVALFLYALIDNMPKFVMEGNLGYDNQLYFNALYFPAHAILIVTGLIYKPLLLRLATAWADPSQRRTFNTAVFGMIGVIAAITVVAGLAMGWVGIPVMSLLYGVDFERFRTLCYLMICAGGVTGVIDFLYQVITVMRRQRSVTRLYLVTFAVSLVVPLALTRACGLAGAVVSCLLVMGVLMVLLLWQFFQIRAEVRRNPVAAATEGTPWVDQHDTNRTGL